MARAMTVDNIMDANYDVFEFTGEWLDFINKPERSGVWFVFAGSGSGKSSFIMTLAKELTKFGKVLYNAREEGKNDKKVAKSFRDRLEVFEMNRPDIKKRFQVVNEDRIKLEKRLDKRRSPEILIIDSIQYFKMSWKEYLEFKIKYQRKTIIIVSGAKGREPKDKLSVDIMFDAYIKIWVEGYKAISRGREIGSKGEITIWEEGANKYWGEKSKQVNQHTHDKPGTHTKSTRHKS